MLGIFLIICLAVYWFIELKAYNLSKDDDIGPAEINIDSRTYNVCHRAAVLYAFAGLVVLVGYAGCAWPYLFIQGIDRATYFLGIAMGILPALALGSGFYSGIRNAHGYIRISADEIEYKRQKSFSVKVNDIRKIRYLGLCLYQIELKEKGKKHLQVNLNGFYKKEEIFSKMDQLRDYCAIACGTDRGVAHKIVWGLEMIFVRFWPPVFKIMIVLVLLYTSYCCIDYDFFRKDYTALFNALGADPNRAENAWPHYVKAAVSYTELEKDFQETIDNLKSGHFDFTDEQNENLRKWFNENASSWASLKEAASINYCNSAYNHISFSFDSNNRHDFSSPSDNGYYQIKTLYNNANTGRLAGALDLDWFDLFQMQLASSKHFANGKMFIDQLVGYAMLARSIKWLSEEDSYKHEDLQKARTLLKRHFPAGLPPLSAEGEIFMVCSTIDDMVNFKKIPVQTPLNPVFLMCGSSTGTEAYARKRYAAMMEQARKGIEAAPKGFSIIHFPILRNLCFSILNGAVAGVYKTSQRAGTNLLAAYVILDLEEYQLIKDRYPADVLQLRQAGLTSQIPDDPDSKSKGKIIYRNDGQRAILYAVGKNSKDDGGYKDDKGSDKEQRDDIIYWQRNLN